MSRGRGRGLRWRRRASTRRRRLWPCARNGDRHPDGSGRECGRNEIDSDAGGSRVALDESVGLSLSRRYEPKAWSYRDTCLGHHARRRMKSK
ncbi:hypothetical protein EVAR_88275_1 [Eumeta japonica]|uniref:Uncharacterized protein n=1 Tax=Eumeta variegata TaxID=151549 RepID=A0A4C1XMV3_EUMVA|nr:hypothetical protein EVAR_88275_1 [Eumeta japonica]